MLDLQHILPCLFTWHSRWFEREQKVCKDSLGLGSKLGGPLSLPLHSFGQSVSQSQPKSKGRGNRPHILIDHIARVLTQNIKECDQFCSLSPLRIQRGPQRWHVWLIPQGWRGNKIFTGPVLLALPLASSLVASSPSLPAEAFSAPHVVVFAGDGQEGLEG